MEKRIIGRSGLEVSVVGLGCNNFGGMISGLNDAKAASVIDAAIDAGITLFDTSDSYGASEEILGNTLRSRRKDVVIATKFGSPLDRKASTRYNGSRSYVMRAVEDSLRRLKTDYIDLYQFHFPDSYTPIEETLRALDDLITQGKVRYIGCSNFSSWQLVDAHWTARNSNFCGFISTQAEYNLLNRGIEGELIPAMREIGMTLLPFFPLASGLLTGKYRAGEKWPDDSRMSLDYFKGGLTEERINKVERLAVFAETRGHTILELAFSWLLYDPIVSSVIAGATSPSQVIMNCNATSWKMNPEDMGELSRILN